MPGFKQWRVNCSLQIEPVMEMPKKDRRSPLVLLIPARCARSEPRLPIAPRDCRRLHRPLSTGVQH
jgi:hypothetical protein